MTIIFIKSIFVILVFVSLLFVASLCFRFIVIYDCSFVDLFLDVFLDVKDHICEKFHHRNEIKESYAESTNNVENNDLKKE
ncbi:MAG: hypothetical protein NC408_09670 [Candidatus Gastranaerophilales bacterium]|nr:hypothetical protein [Candidatus Gastranaerophilales bacterium]